MWIGPAIGAVAALVALAIPVCPAASQDGSATPPATIVVLDGSGSMWGSLEGHGPSKLSATREALGRALAPAAASTRIGLLSFGGGCGSVEMIAPPALGAASELPRLLEKFNPRGKGPLTLGLQQAAKALGAGASGALALVHDGPDNCQQDPCAAAAEIAAAHPGLKIHVLSLALERVDFQAIACVARSTGGRHFDIRDTAGLEAALMQIAKLASPPSAPGPTARPMAATQPPPRPAKRNDGPPGLSVVATLVDGGAALGEPIHWTVTRKDGTPVLSRIAPTLDADVTAGTYLVEARAGLAAARAEIEVAPSGLTQAAIALNAARLELITRNVAVGPEPGSVLVTLAEVAAGDTVSAGDRLPLWLSRAASPQIVLPAGSYRVAAELGRTQIARTVTATAGKTQTVELLPGAGRLELDIHAPAQGAPSGRVLVVVTVDDPNAPGGRREVARSAAPRPVFHLPTGTYNVQARSGAAEVRDRVAIAAGDTVRRSLALPAARLKIAVVVNGHGAAADRDVAIEVTRIATPPERVARAGASTAELVLAEGKYSVSASLGAQNVRTVSEITLGAGESRDLALRLESGTMRLQHRGTARRPPADALCEVRDGRGGVVWRTVEPDPRADLAPGQYHIRCGPDSAPIERTIALAAGEQRVVEIGRE